MAFVSGQDGVWFVWDPCGVICAFVTYGLILFADFVLLVTVVLPEPYAAMIFVYLIFNGLSFLAVASHLRAMVTEPVIFNIEDGNCCVCVSGRGTIIMSLLHTSMCVYYESSL